MFVMIFLSLDNVKRKNFFVIQVRWFPKGDGDYTNSTSLLTNELSATITGLKPKTEYGIQIRAKTQRGWGAYSPVIYKMTGDVLNTGKLISKS